MKRLRGNPGHKPLNTREPRFEGSATPPEWLDERAREEWYRLAPHLEGQGLLTVADQAAFAAYCAAVSRLAAATTFLQSPEAGGSLTYTADSGARKPWQEVAIAQQAADQVRRYLAEFGLSPAARARVVAGTDRSSATEEFLFGERRAASR